MKSMIYVFVILLLTAGILLGDTGNEGVTGMSFLKVGIDARAVGMAEAYTAVSSDASATFWNPAGLANAAQSNVLFNHTEWFLGIRGEYAAMVLAGRKSAWGFHLRSFNIGDIEVRDIPREYPLETTSAHYLSAGVSYARALRDQVNIGVTVKYLFERIFVESASGAALDLGVTYRPAESPFAFGAALQNLGRMSALRDEASKLPGLLRAGVMYRLPVNKERFGLKLAADLVKPLQENVRFQLGGEFLLWQTIAFRAGGMAGYQTHAVSFGLGIVRSSLRLDYALVPFAENLGVTHRFSVNFAL